MKKIQIYIGVLLLLVTFILAFPRILPFYETITQLLRGSNKSTIVFIPGLGLKPKDYHSLISHLTSDHYHVITYTSKDTTVNDYQTTVNKWSHDVGTLIGDKKVILIGHSVGGAVATHFCSIDKRCIAGVNLDGGTVSYEKLSVPFLYIQGDVGSYCDIGCLQGRALMEKIASQPGTKLIHISGIKHYNFTDLRTVTLKSQDYLGSRDGRDIIYSDIKSFLEHLPE